MTSTRGTGTSGHIRRNLAAIRGPKRRSSNQPNPHEVLRQKLKQAPGHSTLAHETRRKVEVAVAELEEKLEGRGYDKETIESMTQRLREKLLGRGEEETAEARDEEVRELSAPEKLNDEAENGERGFGGRAVKLRELQEHRSRRLREAMGLATDYVEGSAFKHMKNKRDGKQGEGAGDDLDEEREEAPDKKPSEDVGVAGANDTAVATKGKSVMNKRDATDADNVRSVSSPSSISSGSERGKDAYDNPDDINDLGEPRSRNREDRSDVAKLDEGKRPDIENRNGFEDPDRRHERHDQDESHKVHAFEGKPRNGMSTKDNEPIDFSSLRKSREKRIEANIPNDSYEKASHPEQSESESEGLEKPQDEKLQRVRSPRDNHGTDRAEELKKSGSKTRPNDAWSKDKVTDLLTTSRSKEGLKKEKGRDHEAQQFDDPVDQRGKERYDEPSRHSRDDYRLEGRVRGSSLRSRSRSRRGTPSPTRRSPHRDEATSSRSPSPRRARYREETSRERLKSSPPGGYADRERRHREYNESPVRRNSLRRRSRSRDQYDRRTKRSYSSDSSGWSSRSSSRTRSPYARNRRSPSPYRSRKRERDERDSRSNYKASGRRGSSEYNRRYDDRHDDRHDDRYGDRRGREDFDDGSYVRRNEGYDERRSRRYSGRHDEGADRDSYRGRESKRAAYNSPYETRSESPPPKRRRYRSRYPRRERTPDRYDGHQDDRARSPDRSYGNAPKDRSRARSPGNSYDEKPRSSRRHGEVGRLREDSRPGYGGYEEGRKVDGITGD